MGIIQEYKYISVIVHISIAIAGFAIILNAVGICLIRKQGAQRKNQFFIVLHLSILQIPISTSILVYWTSVLIDVDGRSVFIDWNLPILITSRIAVNLIIAILTADRLLAVKYSLRYRSIVSKRRLKLALIISWLSWLIGFLIIKLLRARANEDVITVIVLPTLDCSLLLLIVYTYFYIYWKIRRRRRTLANISSNTQQMRHGSKQAIRVSTTIILSYVIFVALPDYTDSILEQVIESQDLNIVLFTAYLLDTCYFIALPVIYIFLHRDMRRGFVENVLRFCSRKNDTPNNANMIALTERRMQYAVV